MLTADHFIHLFGASDSPAGWAMVVGIAVGVPAYVAFGLWDRIAGRGRKP